MANIVGALEAFRFAFCEALVSFIQLRLEGSELNGIAAGLGAEVILITRILDSNVWGPPSPVPDCSSKLSIYGFKKLSNS
jgi:hypothetical protein